MPGGRAEGQTTFRYKAISVNDGHKCLSRNTSSATFTELTQLLFEEDNVFLFIVSFASQLLFCPVAGFGLVACCSVAFVLNTHFGTVLPI